MKSSSKKKGLLIPVILLVLSLSMAVFIAKAEVFEKPPMLTYVWSYDVNKGVLTTFSWSSQGDKVAIAVNLFSGPLSGKIIILNSDGDILWDTGDIGSPVADISWSFDDEYIALILLPDDNVALVNTREHDITILKIKASMMQWSPRENLLAIARWNQVKVLNVSGDILWDHKFSENTYIYDIKWSPDGERLAVVTSTGLTILYKNGSIAWTYNASTIVKIAWSEKGDMISILLKNNDAKNPCEIIVLDKDGGILWSVNERICIDIAWGPNGKILISGINLTLYDSSGNVIWTRRLIKGAFVAISEYRILWNPSDKNITLLYFQDITIIDSDTGETIWSGKIGVKPQDIQWNKDGDKLAIKTSSRLIIYNYGLSRNVAVITVSSTGCWFSCLVVFNDGHIAKEYTILPNKTVTLYATPGNYTITFKALSIPAKYIAGDFITWLSNKTLHENLTVEAGKKYSIKIPVEELRKIILGSIGKFIITAPPDTIINIYWGSNNEAKNKFTIPDSGEITVYAVPGEYRIMAQLPTGETKSYETIKIGSNETKHVEIKIQYERSSPTSTAKNTTTSKTETTITTATSEKNESLTVKTTQPVASINTWLIVVIGLVAIGLIIAFIIKSRH